MFMILPNAGTYLISTLLYRYRQYLGPELNNISSLYQSYDEIGWQRFLQFTDIRMRLLHPATDGEEVNGGLNLFKYYYAISDIQITAE